MHVDTCIDISKCMKACIGMQLFLIIFDSQMCFIPLTRRFRKIITFELISLVQAEFQRARTVPQHKPTAF